MFACFRLFFFRWWNCYWQCYKNNVGHFMLKSSSRTGLNWCRRWPTYSGELQEKKNEILSSFGSCKIHEITVCKRNFPSYIHTYKPTVSWSYFGINNCLAYNWFFCLLSISQNTSVCSLRQLWVSTGSMFASLHVVCDLLQVKVTAEVHLSDRWLCCRSVGVQMCEFHLWLP